MEEYRRRQLHTDVESFLTRIWASSEVQKWNCLMTLLQYHMALMKRIRSIRCHFPKIIYILKKKKKNTHTHTQQQQQQQKKTKEELKPS